MCLVRDRGTLGYTGTACGYNVDGFVTSRATFPFIMSEGILECSA